MSQQDTDGYGLRISKSPPLSSTKTGDMCIVVCQPHAFLERELKSAFKGQADVTVRMDIRKGERRKYSHPVSVERRKMNRRRPKAELLEVFIAS